MAKNLRPPEKLILEGNLKENFRRFRQQFDLYMTATGLSEKDDAIKSSTLLTIIGSEALEIYNTFTWATDGDNVKVAEILNQFEQYCNPRKNVPFERHLFNNRKQGSTETIDAYVTELRILSSSCEFGELRDSLIRDRIVCGVNSESVRLRLLRETDLTLQRAIDLCRASELSEKQVKQITGELAEATVGAVSRRGNKRQQKSINKNVELKKCLKCGRKHDRRNCPAFGKTCHKCGKLNHFAKLCQSNGNSKIRTLAEDSSEEDTELVGQLRPDMNSVGNDWSILCQIGKIEIPVLVDTGAKCNVISTKLLKKLKCNQKVLVTKGLTLRSYSGHAIVPVGTVTLKCKIKGTKYNIDFYVIKQKAKTILGAKTSENIGLVQKMFTLEPSDTAAKINRKIDLTVQYKDVFEGIGCLPGKHKMHLDKKVQPVVHPPRKIPIKLKEKVKEELNRMEREQIIVRETEPTDWVSSLVTVLKPGGAVRVCLDPRDLNRAIKRQHYPLKTVEEVMANMPGVKYFSKLDATSSFWQIALDDESSKLCTFNTPFGRYRYLRLPYGVHSAPEVMQCAMTKMVEGIEGVEVIIDDILVSGTTVEEHDSRLTKVLQKAQQYNLKLNKNKCLFRQTEVPYVGHLLTDQGVKPDRNKVKAVEQMSPPTNKQELMTFLGFIQYLAKFLPNLSQKSEKLRSLLKKDVCFEWDPDKQASFEELKNLVTKAPVLRYFDVQKQVTLTLVLL